MVWWSTFSTLATVPKKWQCQVCIFCDSVSPTRTTSKHFTEISILPLVPHGMVRHPLPPPKFFLGYGKPLGITAETSGPRQHRSWSYGTQVGLTLSTSTGMKIKAKIKLGWISKRLRIVTWPSFSVSSDCTQR